MGNYYAKMPYGKIFENMDGSGLLPSSAKVYPLDKKEFLFVFPYCSGIQFWLFCTYMHDEELVF